ncbi:KTSC domain-containing protein [Sphingomonas sp. Root241]|uniref:KTSC domain-containing protein n=1 Tax=Sphingomonas sp. Root241 TaxID=1736501 RepID=UPI000AFF18CD|nr:KTSC domain-containing protein [Sphingomonas sp. Root241]
MRCPHMPSSVIRRWDYDEAEHRLDIIFVSGKRYSYHDVPPRVAEGMREAFSKGSYFNRRIRDRFAFTEHRARASIAD